MRMFNENLNNFLTECRNGVLDELQSNKRYADRKSRQSELRTKLMSILNPEAQSLLEDYTEVSASVQSMEYSRVLLCGLTMQSALHKRFDTSTPEYQEFLDEYS